jgi:hypothetical protein
MLDVRHIDKRAYGYRVISKHAPYNIQPYLPYQYI